MGSKQPSLERQARPPQRLSHRTTPCLGTHRWDLPPPKHYLILNGPQAFHWFSNLPSLRSIHRVLRRHGALGLIWNIEHWNAPSSHTAATPWEQKVHSLLWSLKSPDDSPRYRDEQWRKVFDEQVKKTPLSLLVADQDQLFALPLGETMVEWEVRLSREGAWERFATLSQVAVLEGSERQVCWTGLVDVCVCVWAC